MNCYYWSHKSGFRYQEFPEWILWNHFRISVPFSITKSFRKRLSHPSLQEFPPSRTEAQRKQCRNTDPTYAVPFQRGLQAPWVSIQHFLWTLITTEKEKRQYFLSHLFFSCPSVLQIISFVFRTDRRDMPCFWSCECFNNTKRHVVPLETSFFLTRKNKRNNL